MTFVLIGNFSSTGLLHKYWWIL